MKVRRIISLFAALIVSVCGFGISAKIVAAETEPIPIDMYLIGGQSNAAGYSAKGNLREEFENVGYAGAVDKSLMFGTYGNENIESFSEFQWSVTTGLGKDSNSIGPEYGLAKVLNDKYSGTKKAFIFKSAAGGTALRDVSGSGSGSYGNWYPRSRWPEGYTPSLEIGAGPTGVQYQLFVENFRHVYNELVDNGYQPTVKGMVWMQGCDDLGFASEYAGLLKSFITDMRADLTSITQSDLSTMPFIIGKIATSLGHYDNAQVPEFNAMQEKVSKDMVRVKTVETSDLILVNKDGSINGTDMYHFNTNDAVTLGRRFAEKLLEIVGLKYVTVQADNGQVMYMFNGNQLTLTFVPKEEYRLSTLKVDGVEIPLEDVVDNCYVIENVEEDVVAVEATFVTMFETFNITYASLKGKGVYSSTPKTVKEGKLLTVTVNAFGKYVIDSVTFNGEPMEYIGDNKYQILPKSSGEVKVIFSEQQSSQDSSSSSSVSSEEGSPTNNTSAMNIGCVGSVGALGWISVLAMACLAVKKHKD